MGRPPLHRNALTLKFLCSYGGKILPRYPDRKLRYYGGETRLLAVTRSISFTELLLKLGQLCGCGASVSVSLRCQLPREDLDALVSITSDEDLANLIEEYDRAASPASSFNFKIRAFLSLSHPKLYANRISPPHSSASFSSSSSSSSASSPSLAHRCSRHMSLPNDYSYFERSAPLSAPLVVYSVRGKSRRIFVNNGNSWG